MGPSTRSKSGSAKDLGHRAIKGGSTEDALPSMEPLLEDSVDELRQQANTGEQVEIYTDSSSNESDNSIGDEERSEEQVDLNTDALQIEGDLLADQVFDKMP